MSPPAGQLVTETFEYDGGRQVTLYVPPDPVEAVVSPVTVGGTSRGWAVPPTRRQRGPRWSSASMDRPMATGSSRRAYQALTRAGSQCTSASS
jgi:hypothetical protein